MNNQKRYLLLFVVIFAIGALAYSFLVPSFETTDFDPEVIEDISKVYNDLEKKYFLGT